MQQAYQLKKLPAMRILEALTKFVSIIGSLLSKVLAYLLYFQICFVYFSTRGIGFVIYMITFIFAFFAQGVDPIRILCFVYVTYLFGLVVLLKLIFQSKKIEDWVCREVGAEKVRKKLYNSPLLGFTRVLIAGSSVSALMELTTYGAKTAGNVFQSREAANSIHTTANLQVAELHRSADRQLAFFKDTLPAQEYQKRAQKLLEATNKGIAEIRKWEETGITAACAKLTPQQGLLGETANAIRDTTAYENVGHVVVSGVTAVTGMWR